VAKRNLLTFGHNVGLNEMKPNKYSLLFHSYRRRNVKRMRHPGKEVLR
jgi:hypothetical protein